MARLFSIITALFISGMLLFVACGSDESGPLGHDDHDDHDVGHDDHDDHDDHHDHGPGEEELITTVVLTLTPLTGGTPISARFQDLDGEGGNAPTVENLIVANSIVYNGSVELLNETETPAEDITEEVKEESEEHQFFYETTGGISSAVVTYADHESDYGENIGTDHPVGIAFQLEIPQAATNGSLRVILSHYDHDPKDGSTRSDETDIDVTFDVIVE